MNFEKDLSQKTLSVDFSIKFLFVNIILHRLELYNILVCAFRKQIAKTEQIYKTDYQFLEILSFS